jgi:hypothetical protein
MKSGNNANSARERVKAEKDILKIQIIGTV